MQAGGAGGLLRRGVAPLSGSFTLAFRDVVSARLAFDTSACEVQAALAGLPSLPIVTAVAVSGGGASVDYPGVGARAWRVTFTYEEQCGDVPRLVVDARGLLGNDAGARVRRRRGGRGRRQRGRQCSRRLLRAVAGRESCPRTCWTAALRRRCRRCPTGALAVSRKGPDAQLGYT